MFRFLLGCGEGPNWPGATKATSEWFPARERAWSVAFFDSGSSIGGAIAPFIVLFSLSTSWGLAAGVSRDRVARLPVADRLAALYFPPEQHPRITEEELQLILESRKAEGRGNPRRACPWLQLLRISADLGHRAGADAAGSLLVSHCRLVRSLPGAKGLFDREQRDRILGSVSRSRSGQLLRRRAFELVDSPGLAGRPRAPYGAGNFRTEHAGANVRGVHLELRRPARAIHVLHVRIRGLFDDVSLASGGCVRERAVASVSGMGGTAAGIGTLMSTSGSAGSRTGSRSSR